MDEFISMVTEKLGMSSDDAGSATGSVLNMVKQAIPADDFTGLLSKLPGADKLVDAAGGSSDQSDSGGGLLGGVANMASGVLGGNGGGLDVMSSLSGLGLDPSKATSFVSMLFDFIKGKVGEDVVEGILEKVPMLKSVVG